MKIDISYVAAVLLIGAIAADIACTNSYDKGYKDGSEQVVVTETVKYIEVPAPTTEPTATPTEKVSLGMFETTAYCPCVSCCGKSDGITATGTKATAGRTIAVDPNIIPYGTEVIICGNTYIAEDCGGAIKGNRIDIYFDSHQEAIMYGRQTVEVFIQG